MMRALLGYICIACMLSVHVGAGLGQDAAARANAAYARAIELESEGNYPAALALLWEAAGLTPRDAEVQSRLGEALERIGAIDAAVDAYAAAVRERPAFKKASSNLIMALVKAGRGAEAVERARALVAEAPGDPDAHFRLGLAEAEQDIAAAVGSFKRAIELAPRHALARYNLALVLRRADRLPEALDELERTLAIEPRPEAHYTLGVIRWHQGDLEAAARSLRAAVALEPRYVDAHYTLGAVLKARRDWRGAAESLRRAVALQPDLPAAHYTLAQVLKVGGDDEGSRTHLAQAERLRSRVELEREALTWTSVGIQKVQGGDLAAALEDFRRATAAFEPYAPAHYQMGLVLERLGNADAARTAFARARALNPSLVSPRDTPGSRK